LSFAQDCRKLTFGLKSRLPIDNPGAWLDSGAGWAFIVPNTAKYRPQRGCGILPGNMAEGLRQLRIFLSSPGDVPAERKTALEVIELLQYESQFKDSVFLEVVAWDKHSAGTPMLANKTPQAAIDEDCRRTPNAISGWPSR
jgi:hypothetical protein